MQFTNPKLYLEFLLLCEITLKKANSQNMCLFFLFEAY